METDEKYIGYGVVLALLASAALLLFKSWVVMLLLGAAASLFDVPVLAIGYFHTVVAVWLLNLIASPFKSR